MKNKLISVVIPVYNESKNITGFYSSLKKSLPSGFRYEIIYVNDGSSDDTKTKIQKIIKTDKTIKLLSFSKNFGKEIATTAGINNSKGDAVIIIDADGQHPANLIPEFIEKWIAGSNVVIGVRNTNHGEGYIKKIGSMLFYKLFNSFTASKLIPGSTDFRLIDGNVRDEFNKLHESNRITRGLIDWLGYKRTFIYFNANERVHGEAGYSTKKLIILATNSFVSMTFAPLFFFAFIGVFITCLSVIMVIILIFEQFVLSDPLNLRISGTAYLAALILLLVGIILMSQGLLALYISRIYQETQGRQLYIIDENNSVR